MLRHTLTLLVGLGFASTVCGQFVPEKTVLPITHVGPDFKRLSLLGVKFGTGFCLDPDCRFIGTNYHVAKSMGRFTKIEGVWSAHTYLNSSSDEEGAEKIHMAGGPLNKIPILGNGSLKFNPAHDLAIIELRHPLSPKGFRGIAFDQEEPEGNPEVDIYAYPLNRNPKRGLVFYHGKFLGPTKQGLYAFEYEGSKVKGGASGGIIIDHKTGKIIAILNGIGKIEEPLPFPVNPERIITAVPIKELAAFVGRAQPYLQATLFPKDVFISPVADDAYKPYVWPHPEGLTQRPVETPEVVALRKKAQELADGMHNWIAMETFAWGRGNRQPEFADSYETLIADGFQRFRRLGEKHLYNDVPFPPLGNSIVSGGEWSELPTMVGTARNLRIHQADDITIAGKVIHIFQYNATVEDEVCEFRSDTDLGFMVHHSDKFYSCHGEVWTEEDGTILRISEALDLQGPWFNWWGVVTYGWLEKEGEKHLIPVTITTQAEHGEKIYWCRGLFTDYQMFNVRTRILVPVNPAP